jgi:hypothetical protein
MAARHDTSTDNETVEGVCEPICKGSHRQERI